MWKKFIAFMKKHFQAGNVTDFPNAKECDPNEPCRNIEPRKVKGGKFNFRF